MMKTEIIDRFSDAPPEVSDGIKIRGFFRLQLEEDGKIVGDSGWRENAVTNEGKRSYLARLLGAIAGSSQIGYAALGTGTAPGATATSLDGELGEGVRDAIAAATSGSTAVAFTGTFASGDSFVTATRNLSNIGLFATNAGGTLFAGNTFASSSCGTNQNVNYTYTITFS
jgi:hypothetical protein